MYALGIICQWYLKTNNSVYGTNVTSVKKLMKYFLYVGNIYAIDFHDNKPVKPKVKR